MFSIFKKKEIVLNAPVNGKLIALEDTDDEVFNRKMMGEGVAFILEEDILCAPCDGKITLIPATLHAFGMTTRNEAEILIHIGLDTVELQGRGFEKLVDQGTNVKKGTPIVKVDRKFMQEQGIDLTTPMVITNSADFQIEITESFGSITKEQAVIRCIKK